jgi:type 1 glutamine amidotransferase
MPRTAAVRRGLSALVSGCALCAACSDSTDAPGAGDRPAARGPAELSRVLAYTRTTGYRHDSIGPGVEALRQLGAQNGFSVDQSEEPAAFTDQNLEGYDVVVFLSTTAEVLDEAGQGALERYIQAGGGWVGIHAAADTEYDWPWYGQLLGNDAWFRVHPAIQYVFVDVEKADHASTAHLTARFSWLDELYNYQVNPRPAVTVLLRLDESTYSPGDGAMGSDHPISWYHEFDGGRAWYTGLGHRQELYADPVYLQHVLGGLRWAAGVAE